MVGHFPFPRGSGGKESGGSGGARTCHKSNEIKGETASPSQIASQNPGVPADLRRVIDAWPSLSSRLRAAVLAIVGAVTDKEGR